MYQITRRAYSTHTIIQQHKQEIIPWIYRLWFKHRINCCDQNYRKRILLFSFYIKQHQRNRNRLSDCQKEYQECLPKDCIMVFIDRKTKNGYLIMQLLAIYLMMMCWEMLRQLFYLVLRIALMKNCLGLFRIENGLEECILNSRIWSFWEFALGNKF